MLWLNVEIESLFTLDSSGSAWLLTWDHIHIFIRVQLQINLYTSGKKRQKRHDVLSSTPSLWFIFALKFRETDGAI